MCKDGIILVVAMLAACAAPISPNSESKKIAVKPATEEQVKGCEYLDDIVGTSGLYGVFAAQGNENARADVIAKATKAGATHIVWQPSTGTYGSTLQTGKAFHCTN